jgi:Flp pilus assembly protein TadG
VHLKREEGAAMVEFALVLPILLMILIGIMEFGIILYRQEVITNASREGARAGIIIRNPRTEPIIQSVVNDVVDTYLEGAGLDSSKASKSASAPSCCATGEPLTVNITFPYDFLVLPNFAVGLSSTLNLSATTVMKLE